MAYSVELLRTLTMTDQQLPLSEVLMKFLRQSLSSITFLENYLQISMNQLRISIMVAPEFVHGEMIARWQSREFSWLLRENIGAAPASSRIDADSMQLVFDSGLEINIPTRGDPSRVECVLVEDGSGVTWVV